ncbi:protein phosphatase 2C-like protein [Anaerobacterium chartisolvens]|uniref:Protein phosphatase 2C-like protein n=1 Tax=Anaerobacterium chartisolvens TaxID=1297424 RepID=A0A369BAI5_9FIRM|nr:PP2C family serine/threonine-protein phosphatase [Anaerobacterium chartisolvens]RCX17608.1 protein phosphatase 2C-like protein [Anaerobacterium chartisolvens]
MDTDEKKNSTPPEKQEDFQSQSVNVQPADSPESEEAEENPEMPASGSNPDAPEAAVNPVNEAVPVVPLTNEEVTAHTAALWKYLPVPDEEPECHDEYDSRAVQLEQGALIGARVRGKKHKHEGTNCDDWFEFESVDDWVLIAVSDGAGSKKYSRIGARESCKAAIRYMKDKFSELKAHPSQAIKGIELPFGDKGFSEACGELASIVQRGVLEAYDAVEKAFEARRTNLEFSRPLNRELTFKDFSATMLVAAAIPTVIDGKREYLIISCQIGDGMLASVNPELPYGKALKLLGEPDGGSFAGETDFLTSPQMKKIETLMRRTKIARSPITCLIVMSDGVADDYYPNDPQILRLYMDLLFNKIAGGETKQHEDSDAVDVKMADKIPQPTAYPWVNNPSVRIPLHYTDKIMKAAELSLEEAWDNKDIIRAALERAGDFHLSEAGDKGEALKVWLDNYVERGSFDDRTLVIFHV